MSLRTRRWPGISWPMGVCRSRPATPPLGQEASQPPLYYLLGVALFTLSPGPDLGWSNIPLPARAYLLADLLGLLGVVGLVGLGWELLRRRDRVTGARLVLLLGWVATVSLALVRQVQINAAAHQGRLLFPAAAAVGVGLGAGLDWLVGRTSLGRVRRGLSLCPWGAG